MINENKVFCVTLFSKVAVACLHVTLQRILIGGESFSRNTSTRQVSDKAWSTEKSRADVNKCEMLTSKSTAVI